MKIIFLDIDGVLNSGRWMNKVTAKALKTQNLRSEAGMIDPVAVDRLNRIIAATGALVVISSSWRVCFPLPVIVSNLEDRGFNGTVIGATRVGGWEAPDRVECRGDEIQAWLAAVDGVDDYVIIDDDTDAGIGGQAHFVQTWYPTGLEDSHVEKAIKILNKLDDESEKEADET